MIKILRLEFSFVFLWAAVLLVLFESGIWPSGELADDAAVCYNLSVVGIFMVIILIPMSLKLMSLRTVKASFAAEDSAIVERNYRRWCEIRMAILAVTGWTNLVFYYLTLDSTGGFCALITALALCFCWPSQDKFVYETLSLSDGKGPEAEKKEIP
ncbi:MAG: hypothetical protein LUC45_02545 [Paraprevotella sp.]|nr:hypothetical protein [Paraprevotella sp.]